MAAEQKIRELKILLKNFKRLSKGGGGKMKPNEALKKANKSMNIQPKKKYGVAPELVEKESATSELKRVDHDHSTLKKIDKESARYKRYDIKVDKKN